MVSNVAITPEHCLDPQIAIAACRAGELGILDLGFRGNRDATIAAIDRLAASAGRAGRWGVRWDTLGSPERGVESLSELMPRRAPALIIAGLKAPDFQPLKKSADRLARQILVEVYDLPSAQAAAAAGCDGLIVKGHEAGGWVSRQSTFILLQELRGRIDIPYWVQGGIGMHSAAAAMLAGAAGVVLREQLWLADESPFAGPPYNKAWSQLDGSETVLLEAADGLFRLFSRSGRDKIQELERALVKGESWLDILRQQLREADDPLIPMGQDIAFAGTFAKRYGTVGRILVAMRGNVDKALREARSQQSLAPDSALARMHGTRYPIVQGPMTRVSDVAPFAHAVAEGGGLPFVALAVMRKPQIQALLTQTKALLGDRPWGVGILGFIPLELRKEQLDVIYDVKPPFAIIGGGRPSQARELEALGIASYLHVPSPGLLARFLEEGARKFIFEGSECGGHTGPRTSFILWESAIETLTAAALDDPASVHILFAGGIHDPLSAAMVSVMAAPLVARGMKVGVVMGTAYLFTQEIVRTGAVVEEFQAQAIGCQQTALLQSGVGIYTRGAQTPFCDEFNRVRRELILAGASKERILEQLELLNIGRLRIASKGIAHNNLTHAANGGERYLEVDAATQRREGMYMLGEVARLRDRPVTIAELHAGISVGGGALLAGDSAPPLGGRARRRSALDDIAIIGMACLFPKSPDLRSYWRNIVQKVDAIREVGEDRWSPADFFDPIRGTPDKIYSKWGGFLDDIQFDPTRYGIPPASLRCIEPMQLLALEVARLALEDAGLDRHPFPRERTATIFAVGGQNDLGTAYIFRALLGHYLPKAPGVSEPIRQQIMQTLFDRELPPWTEDSFPGFLGNVVAGRVANRLDLQGANFVVDAACAASLAALDAGVRQLRSRDADVALVGAVDGNNNAVSFMAFAKTHALSPRGRSRPFDDSADGISLGEGVAVLALKRLCDAERDGDRIRAVVKGVGSSSDGRNRSMTAPHPQGQLTALRRAYEDAGVDPATVGLIEAHGTGTAVGDKSEIESLNLAFENSDMASQSCAIGSVKSMIGHTKVTAGLAGLIKGVLALEHHVLPPTIGVETPNSRVDFTKTPFFINTETRPWLNSDKGHPRRCGVSAFGFGGANYHAVLEEYRNGYRDADALDLGPRDAELFAFRGPNRPRIEQALQRLAQDIEHPEHIDLAELAYCLHTEQRKDLEQRQANGESGMAACRLSLLAASTSDLKQKLVLALELLRGGQAEFKHPTGVYFKEGAAAAGDMCFLFPGQGSQQINMLRDLVVGRPELHGLFERADALVSEHLPQALSRFIYPLPAFSDDERARQQSALSATRIAQPALGVVELAAFELLQGFGLRPDFVAGHSYGEYVALCAAGVITPDELIRLSDIRGRLTAEAGRKSPGTMAAVNADGARVSALIEQHRLDVSLANLNAPDQTMISGSVEAIDAAAAVLAKNALRVARLPITTAFHSPAMASARDLLAAQLANFDFRTPRIPVFSNTTAQPYPETADEMRALLARHLTDSVRFAEEIDQLYKAGARIFLEVGPGRVLSGLVDRILADRPHAALAIDAPGRPGWLQLAHLLAQAFALGLPVRFETWFKGRGLKERGLAEVFAEARAKASPASVVWRVNGGRALPWRAPAANSAPVAAGPKAEAAARSSATQTAPILIAATTSRIANPSVTRAKHRFISHSRPAMVDNEGPPTAERSLETASPRSDSQVAQMQRNIAQFLELQRDQQETLRRFLDLQANLIGIDMPGGESPSISAARPTPAPETVVSAPRAVFQAVPPTPVLPRQALADHMNGTAEKPPAPVMSRSAERAPAQKDGENGVAQPMPPALPTPGKSGNGAFPTTEQFKVDLLRAVSERTGYPEDMLDLDAHMEADLGIDSIKRIEIFSGLKDRYNFMEGRDEEAVFEELAGLKTLSGIIAWYDGMRNPTAPPKGSPRGSQEGADSSKKAQAPLSPSTETVEPQTKPTPESVRRYVLKAVAAAVDEGAEQQPIAAGFTTLLLGPVSPVSEALKAALAASGQSARQVIPGGETRALGDGRFEVDLSSEASVRKLRGLLADSGPMVGAVICLLAAAGGDGENDHLADAKALFLLSKVFEQELKEGVDGDGGWLITLTAFDGQFGLNGSGDFPAGMAGVLGVAKSIAREWPGIHVKCIDVDREMGPDQIVGHILNEWRRQDATLEVGFTREERWRLDLRRCGAVAADISELELDSDGVVLVTGGAYGITASVARALAERRQPRLVLVGRSPDPEQEPLATRAIADPAELKRFLIGDLRARSDASGSGAKVTPVEVDRVFKRILKDREMRANMAAMRASGAKVEYHALDARDAEAFGRLIDDVYAKWGRIDGVIHGAGIIDAKLIRDKSLESFAAVYDTKVVPAQVLSRKLRPETLKFLVFFSSIAARFGNAGQCDYSAANEVLNKLADRLSHEWPNVHTVSINWGPWDSGMPSEELLELIAAWDIRPIALAAGTRYCLEELQRRNPGESEIVVTASLEQIYELQLRKSRDVTERL